MTSNPNAGSNLAMQTVAIQPEPMPESNVPPGSRAPVTPMSFSNASFSAVWLFRGHGQWLLNLLHPAINAGSRVVASASEYNIQWNIDRFIGSAPVQVINVSPFPGGVRVWLDISWASPINIAITAFVEP